MTQAREERRLLPTGDCFCGCGGEAEIGRWFVRGHDSAAAVALRAVEGGLSLPQRLVDASFGPQCSVVQEAVERAGWVRCPGCVYAGTPAGLAFQARTGLCAAEAPTGPHEPGSTTPEPAGAEPAAPGADPAVPAPATVSATSQGRAESCAVRGRLLPKAHDPSWDEVPLHLRQKLRMSACPRTNTISPKAHFSGLSPRTPA